MSSLETSSSHESRVERSMEATESSAVEPEYQRLWESEAESARAALREGTAAQGLLPEGEPTNWQNVMAEDRFRDMQAGQYTYETDDQGRCSRAFGQLTLQEGERDLAAQRTVGAEDRRETDDGGHMIGARFGGASDAANLVAQDRNLNRGEYKKIENQWEEALQRGNKVYIDVMAYYNDNVATRPQLIFGSYIIEKPDGSYERDDFTCYNETKEFRSEINDFANVDNPNNFDDWED